MTVGAVPDPAGRDVEQVRQAVDPTVAAVSTTLLVVTTALLVLLLVVRRQAPAQ